MERTYLCIDLKSFYASVECIEKGYDPLTTNLVVADESRTEKTICLAVSPSLKSYGISGRARLFEVVQRVKEVNRERLRKAPHHRFSSSSCIDPELKKDPSLELDYVIATPRMAYYIEYSTRIYEVYLKYISAQDIHVYSIDEVFMDVTEYLNTYHMSAHELAMTMIRDVLATTGITATAGIGTNLYLAKIAMDIVAKHIPADKDGVRIAELNEQSYRELLWEHRPLTDFWRVGKGYARRLEEKGLCTMGDIARCSLGTEKDYYNEELLYELFGVNAELLIDHAWGIEPTTIADIKTYRPAANSIGNGQVLSTPYSFEKGQIIVKEMAEGLAMELLAKGVQSSRFVLHVDYDHSSLQDVDYDGETHINRYGKVVPKAAHATINLDRRTSSARLIREGFLEAYRKHVDPRFPIRRLNLTACELTSDTVREEHLEQFSLFEDAEKQDKESEALQKELEREKKAQLAMLEIKRKFGKNAVLKGTDYLKGATAKERNQQIGGHKS